MDSWTFKAQVAHVQDGSKQLRDLPVLRLSEHEDFHSCLDAGVIPQIVPTVTRRAVPLKRQENVIPINLK